jgi:hypothetical protein
LPQISKEKPGSSLGERAALPLAQMHLLSSTTATWMGSVWTAQRAKQVVKVMDGVDMSMLEDKTKSLNL